MAARASSTVGFGIAIVLLALAFLTTTTLAIVYYLQIEQAVNERTEAQQERSRLVSASDRDNPEIARLLNAATERETLVTQLRREIETLRRMILPDATANAASIDERLRSVQYTIAGAQTHLNAGGEGILADIRQLISTIEALESARSSVQTEAQQARNRIRQLEQQLSEAQTSHAQTLESLRNRINQIEASYRGDVSSNEDALTSVRRDLERFSTDLAEKTTSHQSTIAELNRELERMRQLLRDMQIRKAGEMPLATDYIDGRIVSMIDESRVLIDLGRTDNMLVGLTFEVWDQREIPESDKIGEERGKATLEVIRVLDRTAEARVVRRSPRQSVQPGDLLTNVVYDRYRTFQFFVHGEFDIDTLGIPQDRDRDRVVMMIEQMNARVARELTPNVDFVVLGVPPVLPQRPGDAALPEEIAIYREQMRAYETYHEIAAQAQILRIPVLNQNRFLTLVGYYRR